MGTGSSDDGNRTTSKGHWTDIFSSDNSREGYERGLMDGKEGKNARPASYRFIRKLNFVFGFNHAAATYSQGYRKGHVDGMRVEQRVWAANSGNALNKGDASMAKANWGFLGGHGGAMGQAGNAIANADTLDQILREIYTARQNAWEEVTSLYSFLNTNMWDWNDQNGADVKAMVGSLMHKIGNVIGDEANLSSTFKEFEEYLKKQGVLVLQYKQLQTPGSGGAQGARLNDHPGGGTGGIC